MHCLQARRWAYRQTHAQGLQLVHLHLKQVHLGDCITRIPGTLDLNCLNLRCCLNFHRIHAALAPHRTSGFNWHWLKLLLSVGKVAGCTLAALTLGTELKAQFGANQTWCLSQLFRWVCKIALVAHVATVGTKVSAHLGELQGVSGLLGRHRTAASIGSLRSGRKLDNWRVLSQCWQCSVAASAMECVWSVSDDSLTWAQFCQEWFQSSQT